MAVRPRRMLLGLRPPEPPPAAMPPMPATPSLLSVLGPRSAAGAGGSARRGLPWGLLGWLPVRPGGAVWQVSVCSPCLELSQLLVHALVHVHVHMHVWKPGNGSA